MPILTGADMARPSRTGGKISEAKAGNASPAKGRKTAKPKRHIAPAATRVKRRSAPGPSEDLKEAREQQAATAEILKVIASSPDDVQPVFEAIASSANHLIGGLTTAVHRLADDTLHLAAFTPTSPAGDATLQASYPQPLSALPWGEQVRKGEIVEVRDTNLEWEALPSFQDVARKRGFRSMVRVPLLRDGVTIGTISVSRPNPGKFADHHVELLQTFADQAVIAIENVRLFNETKEALERQTATADILKVIASSPSDVQPVFDTIAESARRLCGGHSSIVTQVIGDLLDLRASSADSEAGAEELRAAFPLPLSANRVHGRAALSGEIAFRYDIENEPDVTPTMKKTARARGYRSLLVVPMMREGVAIGTIGVSRREAGRFTDKFIELLRTFADQAVIAIENARLFNEVEAKTRDLTESLDQQIATGEVLKAISHSAFELQPVFDAIAENSVKLCHAERAFIFRFDGQFLRAISSFNVGPEVKRFVDQNPIALGRHSISARAGIERCTVHVADVHADPEYAYAVRDVDLIRTILAVPMLKSDELVGVITIYRLEVKPFTEKQVSLVETFAAQAVIAVENTRLINELRQSLDDLRAAQDRLVQTQKLASLGQLTAGIAHEIKNPLNFVNNFSGMSAELIGELQDVVRGLAIEPEAHADIKELTDMLSANLGKIVQHGKRADAIVKSMLLHSGQTSGEHRLIDINALVDESLNRAYYGERAETRGFAIKLEKSFDPAVGEVDLFPREISRAILNLISNGFYATSKRKEAEGSDYEPVLVAATRNLGDRVEIRIRDNGWGIPADVKEKMFDPFFTTKPAGEGTGLGLSITHDIIVKQHGGSIEVDTKPGEFAEIRLILPRTGALPSERQ
jgi:two-component system NtrC family sensor kinase